MRSRTRCSSRSLACRRSSSSRRRWKNSGTAIAGAGSAWGAAVAPPRAYRARCSSMRDGGAITKRQWLPPAATQSISAETRGRPKLSSHQPDE